MADEQNIEDWFREPNDQAYIKTEERTGPPLEYVAEKMASSLTWLHATVISMRATETDGRHVMTLQYALKYEIVAYLGLMNMLALVNDDDFDERILNMNKDQFEEWLVRIRHEGTVTGV